MSTKTIAAEKRCETVIENLRELTRDDDDELMDQGGLYFRLYSMNYASFDDIPDELIREVLGAGSST